LETEKILMERRQVMFGIAGASLLSVAGGAFAQGKGIEKDKLKALMGGRLCDCDKRARSNQGEEPYGQDIRGA
jgi:hypothetical protein